jgi:hypothetical protein
MTNIALGVFLILFGGTMLVNTSIPGWVIGLAGVITGLIVLAGTGWWKRGP